MLRLVTYLLLLAAFSPTCWAQATSSQAGASPGVKRAAFVAVKTSGPLLSGKADRKRQATNKFRQDRDQLFANKRTMPGPEIRLGGPLTAAEEDYANRAYPGTDVPLAATMNAHAAFNQVKAHSQANDRSRPGQWTLIGPSTANFPNILTFSGAAYTTS